MEENEPTKLNFGLSKNALKIILTILLISALIVIGSFLFVLLGGEEDLYSDEAYYDDYEYSEECNVAGIELHGDLFTYYNFMEEEDGSGNIDVVASEDVVYYIENAEADDNIEAILLEVDSFGGYVVAGEEIANALKKAIKPTVVLIRGFGNSAAYYAATGGDIIFASANSDVGSIGVTMSYLDSSLKNQAEGYTYNQISSGKFKDTGDPDKSLTNEEKQYLMRDTNIMNENFILAVAENRGLEVEKVRGLADGSSMLGQMAFDNGLIDKLGGYNEVVEYLESVIGDGVEVCW